MQLHFSPSMRSITISSSGNGSSNGGFGGGGGDLMKIKVAPRHISYRTLFHTILILAFLLPFVFILTALVTLEGVNKCSSIGTRFYFHSFLFILNHYMGVLILYFVFKMRIFFPFYLRGSTNQILSFTLDSFAFSPILDTFGYG